jgi:hypothetical protein
MKRCSYKVFHRNMNCAERYRTKFASCQMPYRRHWQRQSRKQSSRHWVMTQAIEQFQFVRPEHRIFWTTRAGGQPPVHHAFLRRFFVQYAKAHPRPLPWRVAGISPFELLAAELLLVQTKAEDVAKVWPGLIARYSSA